MHTSLNLWHMIKIVLRAKYEDGRYIEELSQLPSLHGILSLPQMRKQPANQRAYFMRAGMRRKSIALAWNQSR